MDRVGTGRRREFAAFGLKCSLTAIAVKYGATKDGAYDTFFPKRITRWTSAVFGPVILVGFGLLAVRWGLELIMINP